VAAVRAGDGDLALRFIRDKGRITKDSIAGRTGSPLAQLRWQERLLLDTLARDPLSGRRLHRTAWWSMGRKNGKTGWAAPLALYGLLLEGDGAEVYSLAADRMQAKILHSAAKRTVELDSELSSMLRVYRDAIEYPATGSVYRAMSSESYTKEGLSPTLVLADELHAWPTRELYDVFALAMGAREDPLMLIITTAGVRSDQTGGDSIAYQLYQYGRRVAAGEIEDPTFYFAAWEAPEGCAVDDPRAHRAANPGLGTILDPVELRSQAAKATNGGMDEAQFRIKRLSQWVADLTAALPGGSWERRAVGRRLADGEKAVLFLDGSYSNDSTALVGCAMDGFVDVLGHWERPIDDPHWRIDIDAVEQEVIRQCQRLDVAEVCCDPFRWQRTMQVLERMGLPIVEYNTATPARMVPAWAKFYDAVTETGAISHSGHPALDRHISNLVLKVDRLGPRPVKEHKNSPRKIDLAIAAVGAYDRATTLAGAPVMEPLVAWA
jgi:phage terminase large subunit-like protein